MAEKYPCMREGCAEVTGHNSGFCTPCRTRKCVVCGREFVIIRLVDQGRTRCSEHLRALRSKARREDLYEGRKTAWTNRDSRVTH